MRIKSFFSALVLTIFLSIPIVAFGSGFIFEPGTGGGGGPSGSGTDEHIVRWDGTSNIQNSEWLITDIGDFLNDTDGGGSIGSSSGGRPNNIFLTGKVDLVSRLILTRVNVDGFIENAIGAGVKLAFLSSGDLQLQRGHYTFFADGTHDIGKSASNRPRDIYVVESVVAGAGVNTVHVNGTNGTLSVGIANPVTGSVVDFTSTTAGALLPRMTTAQRDAISSPPAGLMVYNTTSTQYEFYNGTVWGGFAGGGGGDVTGPGSSVDSELAVYNSTSGKIIKAGTGVTVNASGVVAGLSLDANAGGNSLTNIQNSNIDSGAAIDFGKMAGLTASRAIETNGSGQIVASSITNTQLGHLSGVSSNIQTQFTGKASTSHGSTHIDGGSDVVDADKAEISFIPNFYTRDINPSEVDALNQLTAHLGGIDVQLQNIASIYQRNQFTTTDASSTVMFTYIQVAEQTSTMEFDCSAAEDAGSKGMGRKIMGTFRRPTVGDSVQIGATTSLHSRADTPQAYTTSFSITTNSIFARVQGAAGETVRWVCHWSVINAGP